MNWTQGKLRDIKIRNPFELVRRTNAKVLITYSPQIIGRVYSPMEWSILGNGFDTNSNAAWYDHKTKKFIIFNRQEKQPKLQEAMDWCKEQYGITEWEKAPFNSYLPKGSMKKLENTNAD